jgi:anthranilate phosphoribosyltransferase
MLDVCGTGGDRMELFNVSTTSMFVLAAGGVVVVKHGNRGITSKCGGADVLEALGIKIDLSPTEFKTCVETHGLGFMFAPNYHPAFKLIAPVRKMLAAEGVATVFNMIGPLLNPAKPDHQLIGVFSEKLLPKFAEALVLLGRKHAWTVHGRNADGEGVDEISTIGPTFVRKVSAAGIEEFTIAPEQFRFQRAEIGELRGGDKTMNAGILLRILDGSDRGPKRDVVLLNAAAGFVITGIAPTLADGIERAAEQIDSGHALQKLRALQRLGAVI